MMRPEFKHKKINALRLQSATFDMPWLHLFLALTAAFILGNVIGISAHKATSKVAFRTAPLPSLTCPPASYEEELQRPTF